MGKVLITGGSGMIGNRLSEMLSTRGYKVNKIGRTKGNGVDTYQWDVMAGKMDINALEGVDTIIHLAGAGVADKRWTESRKREIYDSRIQSTRLLYDTLKSAKHQVKTIISASAVGYYGDCGAEVVKETHPQGDSFLAKVTSDWESEVSRMEKLGVRHVCCRIGIVLSANGGALPELVRTIPLGVAGYFAKDDLYYPWIHIDDVCGIMIHAIKTPEMRGSYNTTGSGPVPIKEMMRAIVKVKKSKALLIPVPPLALRIALGEMSEVVLQSQRCSNEKILTTGYRFLFPILKRALDEIYKHS